MNFSIKKSDLNFKVYTASSIPTAPGVENDIVIVTSVPMTNWIMSPEEPSGIPRADGDVWIKYSTEGNTFNALKQNAFMIATISAYQYVDGKWVDVDAASCQGGEWVEWVTYLFNRGAQCTNITGGWARSGLYVSSSCKNTGSVSVDNTISLSSTSGNCAFATTVNKVNLADYNKIFVRCDVVESINVFIGTTNSGVYTDGLTKYFSYDGSGSNKTIEFDIADYDETYYISLGGANGRSCTVYSIWVE